MPKQLTRNIYKCVYCEKEFVSEDSAKEHELNSHDIIYIGIERRDLNALLNFIVTNDNNQALLRESFLNQLFSYTRAR
jgi:hypothetical protein